MPRKPKSPIASRKKTRTAKALKTKSPKPLRSIKSRVKSPTAAKRRGRKAKAGGLPSGVKVTVNGKVVHKS